MSSEQNVATLAVPRFGIRGLLSRTDTRSKVLNGSIIMLVGTALGSFANLGYNIAMARMLGPAEFGHAAAAATLLMLFSAVGLSFQLVCAKFVARNEPATAKRRVYEVLRKRAWFVGAPIGLTLLILSVPLASLFRLPSPLLIALLAAGITVSVPMGAKRGALQGLCEFPRLSANFIVEWSIKLVIALLLVGAGFGVYGAVGALATSVFAALVFLPPHFNAAPGEYEFVPASFREGIQAIVFFVGQVVINNIDMLLVKVFFPPAEAGLYAAVAVMGRLLYFASWSVVSAMFPVSAAEGENARSGRLLGTTLLLVGGICALFIAVVSFTPNSVVGMILGSRFIEAGELLTYYAVATAIYCLSVVLIAYEMSRKIANTGWLQLIAGGLVIVFITMFHNSLKQVIVIQIVIMTLLLIAVSLPFLRRLHRTTSYEEVPVR